jgi:hypothetical protein
MIARKDFTQQISKTTAIDGLRMKITRMTAFPDVLRVTFLCARRSLGKKNGIHLKPFVRAQQVPSPARRGWPAIRKRVLRGGGATHPAKRRQRVSGPCGLSPEITVLAGADAVEKAEGNIEAR